LNFQQDALKQHVNYARKPVPTDAGECLVHGLNTGALSPLAPYTWWILADAQTMSWFLIGIDTK